jgi:hypothetical protein
MPICSCKSDNVSRELNKCWKLYRFGAEGRIEHGDQDSVIYPGNPTVLRENHDSFQTTHRSLLPQFRRYSSDVDSSGCFAVWL